MNLPTAKPNSRVLLVEGGGMKGAFAGGVLTSMNNLLPAQYFDLIVAVSSGACSAAYYATTPKPDPIRGEELLEIWRSELAGRRLIWILNPLRGRTLLDQNFLVDQLFRDKYPLSKENFEKQGLPEFRVAVYNLRKRRIDYIRANENNIFSLLKAATALPIATKGKHLVDGSLYCDAAIVNPLPLNHLIESGYKDITVVMNSPVLMQSTPLAGFTRFLSFPLDRKISRMMKKFHHFYFNQSRLISKKPPEGVKILTIAPREPLPLGLVTTKQRLLEESVEIGKAYGLEYAEKILASSKSTKSKNLPSDPKKKLANQKKVTRQKQSVSYKKIKTK
ncbi:patatin-like phospholipase family protein [Leptospira sp. GIMC2001]|uniref:patatin-like phospholipase family protein n=1 Tax=Leptospira sp. GIMC2001 TaxID=1513297 RepID=UPI00234BD0DE|nr:patatin-like phospholipase family protein [Leptospira sp. GIMC2001]WCL48812.1 patatin-like phospholipase family protein [Leptospira sp. GIMC2001]